MAFVEWVSEWMSESVNEPRNYTELNSNGTNFCSVFATRSPASVASFTPPSPSWSLFSGSCCPVVSLIPLLFSLVPLLFSLSCLYQWPYRFFLLIPYWPLKRACNGITFTLITAIIRIFFLFLLTSRRLTAI